MGILMSSNIKILSFDNNASARIRFFKSLQDCARLTLPCLCRRSVALSCGSTYARIFPLWTALKPDCKTTVFFPSDERIVPFDSDESNWGTIYRNFLSHIGREVDGKHHPESVQEFRRMLLAHFKSREPVFDTVFLGAGADGHTASLFPGNQYLDDVDSMVLQTASPYPPYHRLTLGPAVLIRARTVVVVIAGNEKNILVKRFLEKDMSLPIVQILTKRTGENLVFIEESLAHAF